MDWRPEFSRMFSPLCFTLLCNRGHKSLTVDIRPALNRREGNPARASMVGGSRKRLSRAVDQSIRKISLKLVFHCLMRHKGYIGQSVVIPPASQRPSRAANRSLHGIKIHGQRLMPSTPYVHLKGLHFSFLVFHLLPCGGRNKYT